MREGIQNSVDRRTPSASYSTDCRRDFDVIPTSAHAEFPPSRRAGGLDRERFVARRMANSQSVAHARRFPSANGRRLAVFSIADDRPAARRELHANLMLAARLERDLEQRSGRRTLETAKRQRRLLPASFAPGDSASTTTVVIRPASRLRRANRRSALRQGAVRRRFHDGPIRFLDRPFAKLLVQPGRPLRSASQARARPKRRDRAG